MMYMFLVAMDSRVCGQRFVLLNHIIMLIMCYKMCNSLMHALVLRN